MPNSAWMASGEDKRSYVRRMFADIAPRYDLLNSAMSFRLHHRWRSAAVAEMRLKPGDAALDVCCGTGDFGMPLSRAVGPSGTVAGVDFCQPMLELARKKGAPMQLALGDACRLPIRSDTFHAATIGWGLRNVPNIDAALSEIARILKPGGKFSSVDMSRPKNVLVRRVSGAIFTKIVPLLGALFGKREAYTYLPNSTKAYLTPEELCEKLRHAGFRDVRYKLYFFGNICIHWGEK